MTALIAPNNITHSQTLISFVDSLLAYNIPAMCNIVVISYLAVLLELNDGKIIAGIYTLQE